MNKIRSKRLIAYCGVFIFILSFCLFFNITEVNAESLNVFDNLLVEDRENVENFTNKWIFEMYSDDGTYVDNIAKVCDSEDKVTGYIIEFKKENTDNGYMILDKRKPDCVVEFSLKSDSVVDIIAENIESNKNNKKLKKLYSDGVNYIAKIKKGFSWKAVGLDNNIKLFKDWKKDAYVNSSYVQDFVLGKNSVPSGGETVISRADTFVPVKMSELPSKNHCGPTTVLNLIKLAEYRGEGGICNKINNRELFSMICDKMNFKTDAGSTNIQIYKGLRGIVKHINTKVSINEYWFDLWSDFRRDLNAGKAVFFAVNTNRDDGHAMIAVGYRSCANGNYQRVIDNWVSHTERYLLFDKGPYIAFNGAAVVFKNA